MNIEEGIKYLGETLSTVEFLHLNYVLRALNSGDIKINYDNQKDSPINIDFSKYKRTLIGDEETIIKWVRGLETVEVLCDCIALAHEENEDIYLQLIEPDKESKGSTEITISINNINGCNVNDEKSQIEIKLQLLNNQLEVFADRTPLFTDSGRYFNELSSLNGISFNVSISCQEDGTTKGVFSVNSERFGKIEYNLPLTEKEKEMAVASAEQHLELTGNISKSELLKKLINSGKNKQEEQSPPPHQRKRNILK